MALSKREKLRQLKEQNAKAMKAQVSAETTEEPNAASVEPKKDEAKPVQNEGIDDGDNTSVIKDKVPAAPTAVTEPSEQSKKASSNAPDAKNVIDCTYRCTDKPHKTMSLMIKKQNIEYTSIRSRQLGMAYQDYLGVLMEEERIRIKGKTIDPFSITHPGKGAGIPAKIRDGGAVPGKINVTDRRQASALPLPLCRSVR